MALRVEGEEEGKGCLLWQKGQCPGFPWWLRRESICLQCGRTWVQSLGQPLEKEMATHSSSTPAWKIPRMEEPGGLQSMGSQRVGHNWVISLSFFLSFLWDMVRKKNWNHRRESWWKAFLLTVIGAGLCANKNEPHRKENADNIFERMPHQQKCERANS